MQKKGRRNAFHLRFVCNLYSQWEFPASIILNIHIVAVARKWFTPKLINVKRPNFFRTLAMESCDHQILFVAGAMIYDMFDALACL
jgi:hypothetical protein